jgi:Mn2+/Fe2+ NRAMP family transporter
VDSANARRVSWFAALAPGILVAATGVGAGDLLTASLGGSAVGLTILWAAWAGATLKWFLNEGIARWQMATRTTLLEGWVKHLGPWMQWLFLLYLLIWSFFTGGALVNACGVAGSAIWPLNDDLGTSKIIWGFVHALAGLALVWMGGFKLFERVMGACIALMFVAVVLTTIMLRPDWSAVIGGLGWPRIPAGGLGWVLGILGGVGGTVTLLSYGYWVREEGRTGESGLRSCRLDLTVGYAMTAIFGVCMVIIGSNVKIERGARLALDLAEQISLVMGPAGEIAKWLFLVGFWGAVFSSLLGVWQSVPYFFADFVHLRRRNSTGQPVEVDFTRTTPYRAYLIALAIVPLPLLWISVKQAQLAYAILGSFFMPILALTLLIMNNRTAWVGARYRNGWLVNAALAVTLAFFVYVGCRTIVDRVAQLSATS